MGVDYNGEFGITIGIMAIGGMIGAGISSIGSIITQKALNGEVNWKSVGVAAVTRFVSGAASASPLGIVGQRIAGGIIGLSSYAADCYVNRKSMKLDEALLSTGMGVLSGQVGGPGANQNKTLTNLIDSTKETVARESRRANQAYASKVISSAISYRNNILSLALWSSGFRFSAGCGISNGVMTWYSGQNFFKNAPKFAWR